MFGSLVRRGGAPQFVPQLEPLGVRITPASKPTNSGDIWAFTTPADVRHNGDEIPKDLPGTGTVSISASRPTTGGDIDPLLSTEMVACRIGVEIPQTLSHVGTISTYGSKPGVASGTNAEALTGITTHGVWVDRSTPHGVGFSPSAGNAGAGGGDVRL